jgi:hypothetical protein
VSTLKTDAVTAVSTNTSITVKGLGSGVVKLGDGELKFPDADGTSGYFIKTDGSAQLSFAEVSAGGFTLATEQATTSGASVTFGSIPAGTTMIVIMFEGVGGVSSAQIHVEIGDSGGLETAGYVGGSGAGSTPEEATNSLTLTVGIGATAEYHGSFILSLKDSSNFTWAGQGVLFDTTTTSECNYSCGTKSLSAELTQISIRMTSGNLDSGSVNIMYQ